MDELLNSFEASVTKFVTKDDFPVKGKLVDVKVYDKTYDGKTTPTVAYKLEIGGVEKTLESSSVKLSSQFKGKVAIGDTILITREGESFETTYSVAKLVA